MAPCQTPPARRWQLAFVIDGDVEVFSTEGLYWRLPIALADAIASDAVADPVEAAELLDVDMDQFAGPFAFVALDGQLEGNGGQACE